MSETNIKPPMPGFVSRAGIRILQLPIRFYRKVISPLTGSNCRFHPTCSAYALEALERHGIVKGLWLSIRRIGKCHPYCTAEWHDPVPKQFTRHHIVGYKRKQQNTYKDRVRKAPTK